MNKAELLALGLPEERVREFQKIYNRDLDRRARQMIERKEPDALRDAITSTLSTIENPARLRLILATVSHHYLEDYREWKGMKEAAPVLQHRNGQAEQKSYQLQSSASSVSRN